MVRESNKKGLILLDQYAGKKGLSAIETGLNKYIYFRLSRMRRWVAGIMSVYMHK